MNFKPYKKNKGFTLMEVIVSIAVIITALIGSIALISFNISGLTANKSKVIAVSLAQEGLEIVRNVRDTNWLSGKTGLDWLEGLGEGGHQVQYDNLGFLASGSQPLKIDSSGFYQYANGNNTPFSRTITIEYIPGDNNQIKVICEVNWSEKGKNQTVKVKTRLYNWYSATP